MRLRAHPKHAADTTRTWLQLGWGPLVMTIVSGIWVALHLQLSRDLMFWLTFCVLGTAIILNYTALLFRHQWRHFAQEFSHLTLDDFAFAGMGLMWCAIGFGALFFWFGSIIAK